MSNSQSLLLDELEVAIQTGLAEKRMEAKKIIELPAGHASLASMPIEVSALIDEAAKATSV